jgi:hypothetical protein
MREEIERVPEEVIEEVVHVNASNISSGVEDELLDDGFDDLVPA